LKPDQLADNDVFKVRTIYPTNTDSNCAKPWLLGKDDWKDRASGWDEHEGEQSSDDKGNLQYNAKISSYNEEKIN
jgi:hypothetical protein